MLRARLQGFTVLNLIITGIPSILNDLYKNYKTNVCFKPYYNWNTFNTTAKKPGLLKRVSFKPYYNWNTFNTAFEYYIHY